MSNKFKAEFSRKETNISQRDKENAESLVKGKIKVINDMAQSETRNKRIEVLSLIWSVFINIINIVAFLAFVIEQYYDDESCRSSKACKVLDHIQLSVSIVFTLEFAYNFYHITKKN